MSAARTVCVIFDVDGTLVDSMAFNGLLYGQAVRSVLEPLTRRSLRLRARWHEYEHVTDSGVLAQLCRENDLSYEAVAQAVRTRFGALVRERLKTRGCAALPGALAVFESLRARHRWAVGIATGGWGHTARAKLRAAGFRLRGIPLRSADDHPERTGIMRACRAALPDTAETWYVGDGEWDQRASDALGWRFLGVGEALRGRCQCWVPDFSPGRLSAMLTT